MTKDEAKKRIEKLRREIERYRYAYHVLDKSLVSDAVNDSLKKELADLEAQYPEFVTPDSPTQRVGGKPLDKFRKVKHEEPMLSFNDAFSEDDVRAWFLRIENYLGKKIKPEFYTELKIDGLAIELIYEGGVFEEGSTRGDGVTGEDVTQNLKTIEAIPLMLRSGRPAHLVVRGEVFLTKKEFERINKEQVKKGAPPYANPRNTAAGSIRQLDPAVAASRNLDALAYDIVTDVGQKTHAEEHELLHQFGFKTANRHDKVVKSLEEVFAYRKHWEKNREKLPYQVDGIVVMLNDLAVFEEAGVVGKAPRGAIAFKFAPEEATTVVRDIKVQVGRTGALTPVAVMEPVNLGGTTVTHATLHNFDQVRRLDVRVGDTVIVSRAGDVIPQVTGVLKNLRTGKEKKFTIPAKCPVDGSKIVKEGAIHRCSSPNCGARLREELYHFVSRGAFDIEGLGPKIIDIFIDQGLISDAADIFLLDPGDIAALPGFGEKSAENIRREAEEAKTIALPRFLYSLGIFHIGGEMSELIAREAAKARKDIRKPTDVGETFRKFSKERLEEIEGVGPKVAESIYHWFRSEKNKKLLKKLERVGVRIELSRLPGKSGKLKGKRFVLTGSLSSMTRDEAKEKIRALGGEVSESVSGKTDYVVVGEDPGSKFDDAKRIGVQTIDEKGFLALIKEK